MATHLFLHTKKLDKSTNSVLGEVSTSPLSVASPRGPEVTGGWR